MFTKHNKQYSQDTPKNNQRDQLNSGEDEVGEVTTAPSAASGSNDPTVEITNIVKRDSFSVPRPDNFETLYEIIDKKWGIPKDAQIIISSTGKGDWASIWESSKLFVLSRCSSVATDSIPGSSKTDTKENESKPNKRYYYQMKGILENIKLSIDSVYLRADEFEAILALSQYLTEQKIVFDKKITDWEDLLLSTKRDFLDKKQYTIQILSSIEMDSALCPPDKQQTLLDMVSLGRLNLSYNNLETTQKTLQEWLDSISTELKELTTLHIKTTELIENFNEIKNIQKETVKYDKICKNYAKIQPQNSCSIIDELHQHLNELQNLNNTATHLSGKLSGTDFSVLSQTISTGLANIQKKESDFLKMHEKWKEYHKIVCSIHYLPKIYVLCMEEIKRRRKWGQSYRKSLEKLQLQLKSITENEAHMRLLFHQHARKYADSIPKNLFPGLNEPIRTAGVYINDFDLQLPLIDIEKNYTTLLLEPCTLQSQQLNDRIFTIHNQPIPDKFRLTTAPSPITSTSRIDSIRHGQSTAVTPTTSLQTASPHTPSLMSSLKERDNSVEDTKEVVNNRESEAEDQFVIIEVDEGSKDLRKRKEHKTQLIERRKDELMVNEGVSPFRVRNGTGNVDEMKKDERQILKAEISSLQEKLENTMNHLSILNDSNTELRNQNESLTQVNQMLQKELEEKKQLTKALTNLLKSTALDKIETQKKLNSYLRINENLFKQLAESTKNLQFEKTTNLRVMKDLMNTSLNSLRDDQQNLVTVVYWLRRILDSASPFLPNPNSNNSISLFQNLSPSSSSKNWKDLEILLQKLESNMNTLLLEYQLLLLQLQYPFTIPKESASSQLPETNHTSISTGRFQIGNHVAAIPNKNGYFQLVSSNTTTGSEVSYFVYFNNKLLTFNNEDLKNFTIHQKSTVYGIIQKIEMHNVTPECNPYDSQNGVDFSPEKYFFYATHLIPTIKEESLITS